MKKLSLLVLTLFTAIGCAHPQPSPSPTPVIGWTWIAAAGAQSSWTTTLYVATVASPTAKCPTPGGSTYASVGTVSGTATSFSDPNETPGTYICALTQNSSTCGGSPCYSPYSPVSPVFAVPALPTAPGVPTPTVTTAKMERDGPHEPTLAGNAPPAAKGAPKLQVLRTGI